MALEAGILPIEDCVLLGTMLHTLFARLEAGAFDPGLVDETVQAANLLRERWAIQQFSE